MLTPTPRDRETRKADALAMLAMLATPAIDVRAATADEIPGRTLMRDGLWLV